MCVKFLSAIVRLIFGAMNMATEKQKQRPKALSDERYAALLWLAAVIGALPKRFRYRFFAHFHPELRAFFSQEPSTEVNDIEHLSLPVQGELQLGRTGGRPTLHLTLAFAGVDGEGLTVPLKVRWLVGSHRAVVRVEGSEGLVDRLVAIVKGLSAVEQALLWTLLDEALADYEDHLLATDPELVRGLEKRRQEEGRPLEEVWREMKQGM